MGLRGMGIFNFFPPRNFLIWRDTGVEFQFSFGFFFLLFLSVCEAAMRFSRIVAIATVPVCMGIHVDPAAAQTFDERWSIIPKAHAEPAPEAPGYTEPVPQTQPPIGGEPVRGLKHRSA